MKTFAIVLLILGVLFLISQVVIKRATNKTEAHNYSVVKEYETFEVRQYEPALFSYTVMQSDAYKNVSSKGFRRLAGYIFGSNDKNQKIAMTSPVVMDLDDSITMKFKIPNGMNLEDLPTPNSKTVRFKEEPQKTLAVIRFGGQSSDKKIAKYTELLKKTLKNEGINHTNQFSYLGYNPPFEVFGRRNEVVVELIE